MTLTLPLTLTLPTVILAVNLTTHQLDERNRGFSFKADAPLDMRMEGMAAGEGSTTAATIINEWAEDEIAR